MTDNLESLGQLGDRLQKELQGALEGDFAHWLWQDGFDASDFPELQGLEQAIIGSLDCVEEFTALEQWLTTGFIPPSLVMPENKTQEPQAWDLSRDRPSAPNPAKITRNNLPFQDWDALSWLTSPEKTPLRSQTSPSDNTLESAKNTDLPSSPPLPATLNNSTDPPKSDRKRVSIQQQPSPVSAPTPNPQSPLPLSTDENYPKRIYSPYSEVIKSSNLTSAVIAENISENPVNPKAVVIESEIKRDRHQPALPPSSRSGVKGLGDLAQFLASYSSDALINPSEPPLKEITDPTFAPDKPISPPSYTFGIDSALPLTHDVTASDREISAKNENHQDFFAKNVLDLDFESPVAQGSAKNTPKLDFTSPIVQDGDLSNTIDRSSNFPVITDQPWDLAIHPASPSLNGDPLTALAPSRSDSTLDPIVDPITQDRTYLDRNGEILDNPSKSSYLSEITPNNSLSSLSPSPADLRSHGLDSSITTDSFSSEASPPLAQNNASTEFYFEADRLIAVSEPWLRPENAIPLASNRDEQPLAYDPESSLVTEITDPQLALDLDQVMEAITQEVAREYRYFYGD